MPAPVPAPELLPLLVRLVRETMRLPADQSVAGATLVSLGVESMQAIALQYQIADQTGADVTVAELLGDHTVAELATLVSGSVAAMAADAEVTAV